MSRGRISLTLVALSACAQFAYVPCAMAGPHDALIVKHASTHGVPESLVRRVIHIESRGNPRAVSKGNYGLMQIRMGTARAMGYGGTEEGLLDADTNMTYAVKYLAGAYRAAGCNEARAISYYQRGYYGARQSECAAPQSQATQIAERREQRQEQAVAAERATVAARPSSDRAAAQTGDVLKPRLVQTQTISRPKQEPVHQLAATKSESVPVPAVRIQPALMPMPERPARAAAASPATPSVAALSFKDALAQPVVTPEPAMAPMPPTAQGFDRAPQESTPDAVPMPRARPAVATPRRQAVAALAPDAVSAPEQQVSAPQNRTQKRARPSRAAPEEPGLLAALKKLITPERASRSQVTRR